MKKLASDETVWLHSAKLGNTLKGSSKVTLRFSTLDTEFAGNRELKLFVDLKDEGNLNKFNSSKFLRSIQDLFINKGIHLPLDEFIQRIRTFIVTYNREQGLHVRAGQSAKAMPADAVRMTKTNIYLDKNWMFQCELRKGDRVWHFSRSTGLKELGDAQRKLIRRMVEQEFSQPANPIKSLKDAHDIFDEVMKDFREAQGLDLRKDTKLKPGKYSTLLGIDVKKTEVRGITVFGPYLSRFRDVIRVSFYVTEGKKMEGAFQVQKLIGITSDENILSDSDNLKKLAGDRIRRIEEAIGSYLEGHKTYSDFKQHMDGLLKELPRFQRVKSMSPQASRV